MNWDKFKLYFKFNMASFKPRNIYARWLAETGEIYFVTQILYFCDSYMYKLAQIC